MFKTECCEDGYHVECRSLDCDCWCHVRSCADLSTCGFDSAEALRRCYDELDRD